MCSGTFSFFFFLHDTSWHLKISDKLWWHFANSTCTSNQWMPKYKVKMSHFVRMKLKSIKTLCIAYKKKKNYAVIRWLASGLKRWNGLYKSIFPHPEGLLSERVPPLSMLDSCNGMHYTCVKCITIAYTSRALHRYNFITAIYRAQFLKIPRGLEQ